MKTLKSIYLDYFNETVFEDDVGESKISLKVSKIRDNKTQKVKAHMYCVFFGDNPVIRYCTTYKETKRMLKKLLNSYKKLKTLNLST